MTLRNPTSFPRMRPNRACFGKIRGGSPLPGRSCETCYVLRAAGKIKALRGGAIRAGDKPTLENAVFGCRHRGCCSLKLAVKLSRGMALPSRALVFRWGVRFAPSREARGDGTPSGATSP
jgi:hypothetical protein